MSTWVPAPGHLLLQTSIHRRLCVKIKYCLALNKVGTACHRVVPPNTKVKKQMCAPNWMAPKNCTKLPKFKIGFRHKIKASSSPFAGFSNYRVAKPILLRWCLHSTNDQCSLNCSISINFSLPIYCETKAQFSYKEVNLEHWHCITKCKMRNVGQQTFSNVTINNKSVILPTLYCLLYLLTLGKNRLEFPPTTIANM